MRKMYGIPQSAYNLLWDNHIVFTGKISTLFPPRLPSQSWGCGDLSRCRLLPSTIPPWPVWVTIQGQTFSHQSSTISKLAYVRRSFQVQTATSHQPFHPGLCVSLSRAGLSRLRLPQQSLKRVAYEGKPCLKVEQRHPPCLSKVLLS